jgi:hypothetical protein
MNAPVAGLNRTAIRTWEAGMPRKGLPGSLIGHRNRRENFGML